MIVLCDSPHVLAIHGLRAILLSSKSRETASCDGKIKKLKATKKFAQYNKRNIHCPEKQN